jgi:hypothetical protein
MRSLVNFLPLLGSLGSLSDAKPLQQPFVTFASPSQLSPGSAHNIVVEYFGDVDGELAITYGACDGPSIQSARQHIGATHVGRHPLASRHVDHKERRPTKFVWLTPEEMSGGCLHAFLNGEPVGQSKDLSITKRRVRRSENKAFLDVAGDDSQWFNGVAYLQQKQPEEAFVASAKTKSFAILGGGMSGLLSSVSYTCTQLTSILILELAVAIGLCRHSQLEDP